MDSQRGPCALVIPTHGEPFYSTGPVLGPDLHPALQWMQGLVGGLIEAINPPEFIGGVHWHAYVNEEGRRLGLPVNEVGTRVVQSLSAGMLADVLVGPVIIVGGDGEAREHVDVGDVPVDVVALVKMTLGAANVPDFPHPRR